MRDVSERDLYWLAGLLEGEASFHLVSNRGGRHVYPVIRLKMCDRDVVERANAVFGGEWNIIELAPRCAAHKPQYAVGIIGTRAIPWLHRLRPLMGVRRQQQIDRVLAGMTVIDLGHKHSRKLNPAAVAEIKKLWSERAMTQIEIAALYGVSKWTINEAINGHSWASRRPPKP